MCKDFICNHRGVVLHVNFFDSEGRDFGDEDATEGVSNGSVDADERECSLQLFILVELNLQVL